MSTICLGMFLGIPHLQMTSWGVFIASPHTSSRWIESNIFLSMGTSDSPMHTGHTLFIVRCLPRQLIVGVCSSRPLDLTVTQTDWCTPNSPVLQPESARRGPLYADCPGVPPDSPVHTGQVLFAVRCATKALANCPLHGFLH
jgi:hypothetical protein